VSAAIHLAGEADIDTVLALVTAFHEEQGFPLEPAQRRACILPLLTGSPYGSIYLIGPQRAPIGYVAVTFTWSVEFGGLDAAMDEVYLRPGVRGRGIAVEVLQAICKRLFEAGVMLIDLEVDRDNAPARRLYERLGFQPRESYLIMHRTP
jgi:ribosomal protein S18 acetylase RimI-like enzyme